jgi:hypothetical protein
MSGIVGLYVLLEEVQLDPETEPTWIKIRGVFLNEVIDAVSPGTREPEFGPRQGWVHFRLPKREEDKANARAEWKELKEEAQLPRHVRQVVALGSAAWINPVFNSRERSLLEGGLQVSNLVKEVKEDATPIAYPVNNGLLRIRKDSIPDRILEKCRPQLPNE